MVAKCRHGGQMPANIDEESDLKDDQTNYRKTSTIPNNPFKIRLGRVLEAILGANGAMMCPRSNEQIFPPTCCSSFASCREESC